MNWCECLPQWLGAIATFFAVVVALFQKPIRDYRNRPKISITYLNNEQCRYINTNSTDSSNKNNELIVRVKLVNSGKYIANHAVLCVDSYYKLRNQEEYVSHDITPLIIRDMSNNKPSSIVPELAYYYNIALIHLYDEMSAENDKAKSKQFYKLYLMGDDNQKELGKGTFIIPLKFYSSRITMETSYLKVIWNCDDFKFEKDDFAISTLTAKQFNAIKTVSS